MKKQSCLPFLPVLLLGFLFTSCEKEDKCADAEITVTVYADVEFGGANQTFGIGLYFLDAQSLNDKISSFQISSPDCVKVTLYEHKDPSNLGVFKEYTSDQLFIDDLNDKVSAIKVEKR